MSDEFWKEEFNRREIERLQKVIDDKDKNMSGKDKATNRKHQEILELRKQNEQVKKLLNTALEIVKESEVFKSMDEIFVQSDTVTEWQEETRECLAKLGER